MPLGSSLSEPARSQRENEDFILGLEAILNGESPIVFHYQPIVDLSRGVTTGYEALVRFPKAMGPAPDIAFDAASLFGRRLELEEAVTRAALYSRALLPANCFLSLNTSPTFLLSDQWQAVLSTVCDLSGVVIEITEGEPISDYAHIRSRIAQIRRLGGSIAVDDAGAGYASLKHIVEMKPSFIKLDRVFIESCHSDRAKAALIEMMGRAANRLDAWIIAEGIETLGELNELMHLGVPLGQGYYLGRPNPVMNPLHEERASDIRSRNQAQSTSAGLQRFLQPTPSLATPQAAQTMLAVDLSVDTVVVLDKWSRPIEIVERHPVAGIRRVQDIMKTQLLSDPAETLHRALTRPALTRFDPITVIDSQGEYLGILSIDRLMRSFLA
jgi:EAL domain-containing protein (putative c-di-GMP-specific phosphodiesterase class I)